MIVKMRIATFTENINFNTYLLSMEENLTAAGSATGVSSWSEIAGNDMTLSGCFSSSKSADI
jgi:queuine/archaeosine tRNA-ribosyltransferase